MKTSTEFEQDVLNRRQKERPLKLGIHDISCARYFTYGGSVSRFSLKAQQFSDDYSVYVHEGGSKACIGYATPERNKIVIRVRRHGLDWSVKIALKDISIFGEKSPKD